MRKKTVWKKVVRQLLGDHDRDAIATLHYGMLLLLQQLLMQQAVCCIWISEVWLADIFANKVADNTDIIIIKTKKKKIYNVHIVKH